MTNENYQIEPAGRHHLQSLATVCECGQERANLQCSRKAGISDNKSMLKAEIAAQHLQLAELQATKQRCLKTETALKTLEARNKILGDSAPFGIFIVDILGKIAGMNQKMQEMAPWCSPQERITSDLANDEATVPSEILVNIQQCILQQKSKITEHSHINQQGTRAHLRYYFSPVPGISGPGTEAIVFVEDITDLKRTEQALTESERRYRSLYQSAPIAMIERDVTDLNSYLEQLRARGVLDLRIYLEHNPSQIYHCWSLIKTIDHNLAFLKLMDLENCPVPAGSIQETDSDVFREMAREIILSIAQRNKVSQRELAVVTASGQEKFVLGKSMAVSGSDRNSERVVVALVDISERRLAEEALRESERRFKEQSLRDSLTGLFNQRFLYQSLAELIDSAEDDGTQISLIFLDLDHFKRVVDTHGHLNGSRAIREVARTIQGCLEEPAYAVAYAGDEFVVVLPGYGQAQALQKASEIRARMEDTVYVLEQGVEVSLQASFGVATYPENAVDLNSLVAAADQALFAIKESGKNDIGVYPVYEYLDRCSW